MADNSIVQLQKDSDKSEVYPKVKSECMEGGIASKTDLAKEVITDSLYAQEAVFGFKGNDGTGDYTEFDDHGALYTTTNAYINAGLEMGGSIMFSGIYDENNPQIHTEESGDIFYIGAQEVDIDNLQMSGRIYLSDTTSIEIGTDGKTLQAYLDEKQGTLIAGDNITINNNTISASVPSDVITKSNLGEAITAENDIEIGTIKVTSTNELDYALEVAGSTSLASLSAKSIWAEQVSILNDLIVNNGTVSANFMSVSDTLTLSEPSKLSFGSGNLATLLYSKQDTLSFDETPKSDSTNPVTSGGVYNALSTKQNAHHLYKHVISLDYRTNTDPVFMVIEILLGDKDSITELDKIKTILKETAANNGTFLIYPTYGYYGTDGMTNCYSITYLLYDTNQNVLYAHYNDVSITLTATPVIADTVVTLF